MVCLLVLSYAKDGRLGTLRGIETGLDE